MGGQDELYESWNRALAERYFPSDAAGKPVYLSVDDDALHELLPVVGGDGDAAELLASSVCAGLRRRSESLFIRYIVKRTEWRRNGMCGPPPYIGLLGLCVLAASRMARDTDQRIEPTAYYARLNPLLNLPQFGGMPVGFDALDHLWQDLNQWLDVDQNGARGASTAKTHSVFVHIGWPISQCLLREADRRRLTEFFRSVGLEPGTDIDAIQLFDLFQNWVRAGSGLSQAAVNVVAAAKGDLVSQLADIVKREFDVWQGELLDPQGRRRGDIALVLEIAQGGRRIFARLVPKRPEGFPNKGRWQFEGSDHVELAAASDTWYQPLDLEPTAAILNGGLRMMCDGFSLSYEPGAVIPLRASLGVGAWASVHQATAIEEHCVVTTDALLHRVVEFLADYAERGWQVLEQTGNLPKGWRVVQGIRIVKQVTRVDDELRRLAPRLHTATKLEGGLQVADRQYLTAGEPDLWVTTESGRATVQLDDHNEELIEGILRVRLADLKPPLQPGPHELTAGGIRRRFSTLPGFGVVNTSGTGSLGHVFEVHGNYQPASDDAEELPGREPPRGRVFVSGSSAKARPEDLPKPLEPPILVPAGFRDYTVLGATPGEVLRLLPPACPAWLKRVTVLDGAGPTPLTLGSKFQFFDQPVPFAAMWLIVSGELGARILPMKHPPDPPVCEVSSGVTGSADAAVQAWLSAIRTAVAAGVSPSRYHEIWDLYGSDSEE
jgi:hypothetical protein